MSFYRNDAGTLREAPNFVEGPGYTLVAASHASYTYPVEGWVWFNTRAQALAAFSLTEAPP
jgi:hypothetical protein